MRVCLTRKLAERIDGVDLSRRNIGDCFELSESEGRLLVAEQWAFLERRVVDRSEQVRSASSYQNPASARSASAPPAAAEAAPSVAMAAAAHPPRPNGLPDREGSNGSGGV